MKIALFGGSLLKRIKAHGCLEFADLGTELWFLNPLEIDSSNILFQGEDYLIIELSSFRLSDNLEELTNEEYSHELDSLCDLILNYFSPDRIILLNAGLPDYYECNGTINSVNVSESRYDNLARKIQREFVKKCNISHFVELNKLFFLTRNSRNDKDYFFDYEDSYYSYLKCTLDEVINSTNHCFDKRKIWYLRIAHYYGKLSYRFLKKYFDFSSPADVLTYYSNSDYVIKNISALVNIYVNPLSITSYTELYKLYSVFDVILRYENPFELLNLNEDIADYYIVYELIDKLKLCLSDLPYSKKLITKHNYVEFLKAYLNKNYNEIDFKNVPQLIDVWGSCISRTIMNYSDDTLDSNFYCMHLNPIHYYLPADGVELSDLNLNVWDDKCLYYQLSGEAEKHYIQSNSKWLFIDFYSLISDDAWRLNDKIVTIGREEGIKFFGEKPNSKNAVYNNYTASDVCSKLEKFAKFCLSRYGENIILFSAHHSYYKKLDDKLIMWTDNEIIRKKNSFITEIERWFWNRTRCCYIDLAKNYISSDKTMYKVTPFHLDEQLYLDEIKIVRAILSGLTDKRYFSDINIDYYLDLISMAKTQQLGVIISSGNKSFDEYIDSMSVEEINKSKDEIKWLYDSGQLF